MKIKFYNTLHRRVEEFKELEKGKVGLYTCGPTVYNYAHIGNLRAYMFEDLLRRFLEMAGYELTHVMNITDLDDKTIRDSIEAGMALNDFTEKYIAAFHEDVATLNMQPAHHYPRATQFVGKMIGTVKKLEEKGYAYRSEDGSVFFSISKFPEYGKLANLQVDQQISGQRVENDEYEKEETRDFALWKSRKNEDGENAWKSPWGEGRPGWHIECSVMSSHYLGDHFDIHCGGVDNIFPHHENEIAQSCAASGKAFVNYWLHNEHLMVDGQKMAKSAGNFYTLRELLAKGFTPEALRYTLLTTHYRQKLNFTFEKVRASQKAINRLRELRRRLSEHKGEGTDWTVETKQMFDSFMENLGDDLNISGALGSLFIWVKKMFARLDADDVSADSAQYALEMLQKVNGILAVIDEKAELNVAAIELLIVERKQARADKNWARADEIRKELSDMGIALEDGPSGTLWKQV